MEPICFKLQAWKVWPHEAGAQQPSQLPTILRRRVSPLGQKALACALDLPDLDKARLILSSRYGEFSRTLSLLQSIVKREDVSPADFTLSVHHALLGLLSIFKNNQQGHTAIAAGSESFCYGLLEAISCLKENPDEPVVFIHFDEPPPPPFDVFQKPIEPPLALALSLSTKSDADDIQVTYELSTSVTEQSTSHARDFLTFLSHQDTSSTSQSADRLWRWSRHASS